MDKIEGGKECQEAKRYHNGREKKKVTIEERGTGGDLDLCDAMGNRGRRVAFFGSRNTIVMRPSFDDQLKR